MRKLFCLLACTVACGWATAQDDEKAISPRYGVIPNQDAYPQDNPKSLLQSVIRTLDNNRIDYLAAYLIDADTIDAKVDEQAGLVEARVEARLVQERQRQKQAPPELQEDRIPLEPQAFTRKVEAEARKEGFRLVVQNIRNNLAENPDHIRELKRFQRINEKALEAGGEGEMELTVPDVPDRAVYLRQRNGRWYILDQRKEAAAQTPER